jgi:protein-disulfide isomerase
MNRRQFVSVAAAASAASVAGLHTHAAQLTETGLPLQNASFILQSDAATAVASPAATEESGEVRGYILGDPNSPNTLQIYADYRCPHCRMFAKEIEPHIIEDFVKPGRMNIEFLDFTVIGVSSFDDLGDDSIESVQAAEAAACAAEQDGYLAYRDWLLDGPTRAGAGDFSDTNLIDAAEALDLNVDQFSTSLQEGVYEQGVIDSVWLGIERGVQGTPTMILNGGEPFYVPETGYEGLKTLLESELES